MFDSARLFFANRCSESSRPSAMPSSSLSGTTYDFTLVATLRRGRLLAGTPSIFANVDGPAPAEGGAGVGLVSHLIARDRRVFFPGAGTTPLNSSALR